VKVPPVTAFLTSVQAALGDRKLNVVTRRPVGFVGEQRMTQSGAAIEFHEARSYQPGDDIRRVDWNVLARSGQLVVRTAESEVSSSVEVLLDASASMNVVSTKGQRALELAALLTLAAKKGRHPVRLLVPGGMPAQCDESQLPGVSFHRDTVFSRALMQSTAVRRCGIRCLVSDWLVDEPPLPILQALHRNAGRLVLIELLSGEDLAPSHLGDLRLLDAESEESTTLEVTASVRGHYLKNLSAHREGWKGLARKFGAVVIEASSERSLAELASGALGAVLEPL
jgi:uncharacterized protein (DUF58 family)